MPAGGPPASFVKVPKGKSPPGGTSVGGGKGVKSKQPKAPKEAAKKIHAAAEKAGGKVGEVSVTVGGLTGAAPEARGVESIAPARETVEQFIARGGKVKKGKLKPLKKEERLSGKTHVSDEPGAPEILEDPMARAKVVTKPSPGKVKDPFKRGNFVHRFAEHIIGGKLPRPSEAEVMIRFRDGSGHHIRADRINRTGKKGVLIEIRPAGKAADEMKAKLPARLDAVQKEFPKPDGWTGRVVTYTRSHVRTWLKKEGVPDTDIPRLMAEIGFPESS